MTPRVFAVVAHADDIEFVMAGTLILLARAGCEIHMMNIGTGSCGSAELNAEAIAEVRSREAKSAAALIEAEQHPPLVPDIEIFYEKELLARMGAIMREVAPDILLVPSPDDYMEDHMNSCRLAVSAAFCRGMRNYPVTPPRAAIDRDVTIYHAQPHGNRCALNRLVHPDFFVDISTAMDQKADMLSRHRSQKDWLDLSQGMDAYINTMKKFAEEMGTLSTRCPFAEGWRRHNPFGLCAADSDPLNDLIGAYIIRPDERGA